MDKEKVEKELTRLMKKNQLTYGIVDQRISDDHAFLIGDFIPWRDCGPRLPGIEEKDINDIQYDVIGENARGQRLVSLFIERNGDRATYKEMIMALISVKKENDATKVFKLLQKDTRKAEAAEPKKHDDQPERSMIKTFPQNIRQGDYDLKKRNGLAVLVSCNDGDIPTDEDAEAMRETLEFLNYDIHQLQNEEATLQNVTSLLNHVNQYLEGCKNVAVSNEDGSSKAIIFAFSGHGGRACDKCNKYIEIDCKCEVKTSSEDAIRLHNGILRVNTMIVDKFLVKTMIDVPKLFFIDACRGRESLTRVTPPKGFEEKEINYRIDYATIPKHVAPGNDKWMLKTAELLKKDWSLGDIMDEVRRHIYLRVREYMQKPQMPETLNRLTTGRLYLKARPAEN